ncbi:MAG: HD-GYP domain-containing protein [Planctomycetaceae bacterium]
MKFLRANTDETARAVAGLLAGQALSLAFGFSLVAMWLSQTCPGWVVSLGLLVAITANGATLWIGTKCLKSIARKREAEAAAKAEQGRTDLIRTQQAVMFGLAHLAECRDPATGQHLRRMKHLARVLAEAVQKHPKYQAAITVDFLQHIEISAMLHDIGKVGIADDILLKPGKLTMDERREMEQHPLISSQCLRRIEEKLGAANFLEMAHEIALYHHERWDGRGYPFGRRGEAIPISARIVAIADVYDALVSERVYKPAFPHEQCVDMIRQGAGSQFDPDLVEIFLSIEGRFADVSQRIRKHDPTLSMCSFMVPSDRKAKVRVRENFENLDELLETLDLETSPRPEQFAAPRR